LVLNEPGKSPVEVGLGHMPDNVCTGLRVPDSLRLFSWQKCRETHTYRPLIGQCECFANCFTFTNVPAGRGSWKGPLLGRSCKAHPGFWTCTPVLRSSLPGRLSSKSALVVEPKISDYTYSIHNSAGASIIAARICTHWNRHTHDSDYGTLTVGSSLPPHKSIGDWTDVPDSTHKRGHFFGPSNSSHLCDYTDPWACSSIHFSI